MHAHTPTHTHSHTHTRHSLRANTQLSPKLYVRFEPVLDLLVILVYFSTIPITTIITVIAVALLNARPRHEALPGAEIDGAHLDD